MSAQCRVGMKGSRSQQSSPATSGSDSSFGSQGAIAEVVHDGGEHSPSCDMTSQLSPSSVLTQPSKTGILPDSMIRKVTSSGSTAQDLASIVDSTDSEQQATVFYASQNECSSPTYSGLELNSVAVRTLILHHPHMVEGVDPVSDEGSTSWLYDFYPNSLGSSAKDDLDSYVDQSGAHKHSGHHHLDEPHPQDLHGQHEQLQQVDFHPRQMFLKSQEKLNPKDDLDSYVEDQTGALKHSTHHHLESHPQQLHGQHDQLQQVAFSPRPTIFKSQEKYVITLGAPISIAQRRNDDTLTYLNRGQFYNITVSSNPRLSRPMRVRSILALTFFDENDRKVELNHWQYWHNLQANPNQKAFDIDRKNCENVIGNCEDLSYNATAFVWSPEVGAKIVVRINCLSTEFSSQKGVKGLPLCLMTDTYEDLDPGCHEPVHRAFCRIKIFRDKGAERKNKDETKTVERRIQKFMKKQPGGSQDNETDMFHPPSKETTFTSTSTLGPKPFLFTPHYNSSPMNAKEQQPQIKVDPELPPSTFLADIKERVNKRSFSKALKEAKEDFGALEVEEPDDTPPQKAPRIPNRSATTVYVRKKEESIYKALVLNSLTIDDFRSQVARKYDIPLDMIKDVFKRTKKGLLVHFDNDMISRFQDEDDFIIDITFDNQKGYFDLFIHY